MEILQPNIMALFYITATVGYAWAMITRTWKERGAAPAGPATKASQTPEVTLVEAEPAQPQPPPLPSAKEAKDKKPVKEAHARTSPFGFLRSRGTEKPPASKTPATPTGNVKLPTPWRGLDLFGRREATSSTRAAEVPQPRQKAKKPEAHQKVVVGPAPQPAPQRTEYPQGAEE
ncbi:MAG: hypothetical protein LYZ70_07455, partial [Nitrososphaerales archaeon]|nr:hypothetical protein [Nitrososphaerales archaeon]